MNRQELHELQTMSDYPSLSIIAPTHRTAPHNLQDPIRLKNLVTDATSRLLDDFPRRQVAPILDRLDFLVEQIDWRYTQDGLALFANSDCAAGFDLPFPVTERVLIDGSFATRDLLFAMNRSPRYHVLVLGEQQTRLFEANADQLQETHAAEFPISQLLKEPAAAVIAGSSPETLPVRTLEREAYDRAFLRCVEEKLAEATASDGLPLIVAGSTRQLALWNEVVTVRQNNAGTLAGCYEATEAFDLGKAAWPLMQRFMAGQRVAALDELDDAVSSKRYASGIGAVWQTAHDNRCETLLVERNFQYPAWLHPCGLLLNTITDNSNAEFMGNAVDNVIDRVLTGGGRVVFMDNGSLSSHFHIAAVLRG